ncbi:hypothetical protein [Burkholderia pyrrocinia]
MKAYSTDRRVGLPGIFHLHVGKRSSERAAGIGRIYRSPVDGLILPAHMPMAERFHQFVASTGSIRSRLLPMAEFPIERAGARRYSPAAVAPDESRLTSPLQKIDLPV